MNTYREGNISDHKKPGKPQIEALIFDLDGVITQTRKTHKKAWKESFDIFFIRREPESGRQESMTEDDYQQYIDGKPRYDGVGSFLESRSIKLPLGNPDDEPGIETICAVGNLKNIMFNEIVEREGVETYQDAIAKLRDWKKQGIKTAIVSSSKNCKKIIEVAGIADLFDTRVDGLVSAEIGLKGKPDPDIFTEAARRLGVRPENSVVFEDAISGVQAGQKGYFGLVVGVNRFNIKQALLDNGADITIDTFDELDLMDEGIQEEYFSRQGDPIFPDNDEVFDILTQKKPAIFLDYDGTLSPIVLRPEDAIISDEMKETLQLLARLFTVAVVTGRDKEDVENLVGLDELVYAGSHGYIISGPNGLFMEHEDSKKVIPKLDEIEKELKKELNEKTKGTQLDRKRYAIGVHYRNARPEDEAVVYEIVNKMISRHKGFKTGAGKKILEIKPDLDWHKGKAVEWILKTLKLSDRNDIIPVFIGDDITDEDAFKTLQDKGIGILVGGHGKQTAATYALKNVFQVKELFQKLIGIYSNE
ncbi:MAG: trehalose-phosphatase [Bacteroidales bacterium]|nr:trehalose-phosphatase [Bacteroidales bacterium]